MSGSNLARRYAPLVAIAVLQLLIIGFVPSKAAKVGGEEVATSAGVGSSSSATGAGSGSTGNGATGAGTSGATGATGGAATGTGGGATGGGGTAAAPPGVAIGGDKTHCVDGRQFDPKIAFWAPPCVPGKLGATNVDNGVATYKGVTKDEIVLVDYVSNYGAEVNAILQAQGSLVTYDDAKKLDAAWQKFINDHYQLYGRKVKIVTYQGQCQSVPPD